MMKLGFRALFLVSALATAAASPAHAATISYSQSYGPTNLIGPPQFTIPPVAFAQFNPLLGVLTGVTFDLSLTAGDKNEGLENIGSSPVVVTLLSQSTVTLSSAGVTPFAAQANSSVTRSLAAFDNVYDFGGTSGFTTATSASGQAQFNVSAANFANFIGVGNYAATLVGHTALTVQGVSPPNYGTVGSGVIGSGTVKLTYTYTQVAAAIPEPASWVMMIAGFGIVGATMRRRRPVSVRIRYA